jgi:ABC-type lipoprotein export system ATPase subunit/GNAT superfamily N-acetyltransferase
MKINLNHKIKNDKYTEYVYESFDIQNKEESKVLIESNLENLPDEWNIGVVYGGSGTGKTTILKHYFKKEIDKSYFDNEKSLISNFDWLEPNEATQLLSSIGLSSVPTWLRPYNTLSNGEQYRANLAYMIGKASQNEVILVDEYTSVVDRDVAKAMSNALQKYIRKNNKKIVLASCHFDIMEWLQPDWIYSPQKGRLEIAPRLRRPEIKLEIFRCRYETWKIFKQHHYLTEDLNKAAINYLVLWNDKPVGFIAILPFPGVGDSKTRRISRIVILPDYQGLGIGKKIIDYISSLYSKIDSQMFIRTINPALGISLTNDVKNWQPTTSNLKANFAADTSGRKLLNKISYSFKYIGQKSTDSENIIIFDADAYKHVSQNQIELF